MPHDLRETSGIAETSIHRRAHLCAVAYSLAPLSTCQRSFVPFFHRSGRKSDLPAESELAVRRFIGNSTGIRSSSSGTAFTSRMKQRCPVRVREIIHSSVDKPTVP